MFAPAGTASQAATEESQTAEGTLLQRTGIAMRDYTKGEGLKLVQEMLQAGARVVDSVGEAIQIAKQYS